MHRRTLLKLGFAAGAVLAVAGGTLALLSPGRRDGALTEPGRAMFTAVAAAVLSDLLPSEPAARARANQEHLSRLQDTIAGMPPNVQAELDELITIVSSAPGRLGLVGLRASWRNASVEEVSAALQDMRSSSLALRQQAFHALRDLCNASYLAGPATWPTIGYPGPRAV